MSNPRFSFTKFIPNFFKVATLSDLSEINRQLSLMGLPAYFLGVSLKNTKVFNPYYQVNPEAPPQFVVGWRGVRLVQLYLLPAAERGTHAYNQFAQAFYQNVPEDQMPDYINSPEITIYFDENR